MEDFLSIDFEGGTFITNNEECNKTPILDADYNPPDPFTEVEVDRTNLSEKINALKGECKEYKEKYSTLRKNMKSIINIYKTVRDEEFENRKIKENLQETKRQLDELKLELINSKYLKEQLEAEFRRKIEAEHEKDMKRYRSLANQFFKQSEVLREHNLLSQPAKKYITELKSSMRKIDEKSKASSDDLVELEELYTPKSCRQKIKKDFVSKKSKNRTVNEDDGFVDSSHTHNDTDYFHDLYDEDELVLSRNCTTSSPSSQTESSRVDTTIGSNIEGDYCKNTVCNVPKESTADKATQYSLSTTTRACSTMAFIKTRSIGVNFPEIQCLTVEEILNKTLFTMPEPVLPITDNEIPFCVDNTTQTDAVKNTKSEIDEDFNRGNDELIDQKYFPNSNLCLKSESPIQNYSDSNFDTNVDKVVNDILNLFQKNDFNIIETTTNGEDSQLIKIQQIREIIKSSLLNFGLSQDIKNIKRPPSDDVIHSPQIDQYNSKYDNLNNDDVDSIENKFEIDENYNEDDDDVNVPSNRIEIHRTNNFSINCVDEISTDNSNNQSEQANRNNGKQICSINNPSITLQPIDIFNFLSTINYFKYLNERGLLFEQKYDNGNESTKENSSKLRKKSSLGSMPLISYASFKSNVRKRIKFKLHKFMTSKRMFELVFESGEILSFNPNRNRFKIINLVVPLQSILVNSNLFIKFVKSLMPINSYNRVQLKNNNELLSLEYKRTEQNYCSAVNEIRKIGNSITEENDSLNDNSKICEVMKVNVNENQMIKEKRKSGKIERSNKVNKRRKLLKSLSPSKRSVQNENDNNRNNNTTAVDMMLDYLVQNIEFSFDNEFEEELIMTDRLSDKIKEQEDQQIKENNTNISTTENLSYNPSSSLFSTNCNIIDLNLSKKISEVLFDNRNSLNSYKNENLTDNREKTLHKLGLVISEYSNHQKIPSSTYTSKEFNNQFDNNYCFTLEASTNKENLIENEMNNNKEEMDLFSPSISSAFCNIPDDSSDEDTSSSSSLVIASLDEEENTTEINSISIECSQNPSEIKSSSLSWLKSKSLSSYLSQFVINDLNPKISHCDNGHQSSMKSENSQVLEAFKECILDIPELPKHIQNNNNEEENVEILNYRIENYNNEDEIMELSSLPSSSIKFSSCPLSPPHSVDQTTSSSSKIIEIPLNPIEKYVKKHYKDISIIKNYMNKYDVNTFNEIRKIRKPAKKNLQEDNLIMNKLKNIIKGYLSSSGTLNDVSMCIKRLIQINHNKVILSDSIIEIIKNTKKSCNNVNVNGTAIHQKCILLIMQLTRCIKNFNIACIDSIERNLFKCNRNSNGNGNQKNIDKIMDVDLIQFYIGLINSHYYDYHSIRVLIAKCLFYCSPPSMILNILLAFPDVLPKLRPNQMFYDIPDDPLVITIQFILNSKYFDKLIKNSGDTKFHELTTLLMNHYNYKLNRPSLYELLKNLFNRIMLKKFYNIQICFVLICKFIKVNLRELYILRKFIIPNLNEFLGNKYDNKWGNKNDTNEIISCLLNCFSIVIRSYPIEHDVEKYFNLLSEFLNSSLNDNKLVQQSAVCAIMRLYKFDYKRCYRLIKFWKPNYKIDRNVKLMIKSYLYRKNSNFWESIEIET